MEGLRRVCWFFLLTLCLTTGLNYAAKIGDRCATDEDCNTGAGRITGSKCGVETRCECLPGHHHINPTTCIKRNEESARRALEYVAKIASSEQCEGGTGTVLPLAFDHTTWEHLTRPAISTANFLTDVLVQNNNSLDGLTEHTFFRFVRNNVNSERLVVGSAIAIEPNLYSDYPDKFSPYAYRNNSGVVNAHDLSMNYNYFTNDTEWYHTLRVKDWSGRNMPIQHVSYNFNTTAVADPVSLKVPSAVLSDGHWTLPYYDCGGANIWMVTYSSPMFGVQNDSTTFAGIATIDIELTYIDINQCEADEDFVGALDVFHGTHKCQRTTQCFPIAAQGFKRGAYECRCEDGYFFPDTSAKQKKFYMGTDLEDAYDKSPSDMESVFVCSKCKPGCDVCVDDTPCMYETNMGARGFLLLIGILTLIFVIILFILVIVFRKKPVIETGGFSLLLVMLIGAAVMCGQIFAMFEEPEGGTCIAQMWLHHLGFIILYSALMLKAHRISAHLHFHHQQSIPHVRIGTDIPRRRKSILDIEVAPATQVSGWFLTVTRLIPMVLIGVAYLIAWTVVMPSEDTIELTNGGLKFVYCSHDTMEYIMFAVEAILLLFVTYLSFTVRIPLGHFPDGRHIKLAAYTALLLGIVVTVVILYAVLPEGPDFLYVLHVVRLQVFVTVTIAIVFIPKIKAVSTFGGVDLKQQQVDETNSRRLDDISE